MNAAFFKNSESIDNYLKAIYSLSGDEQRCVGGSELASRLEISPASVTNMLQKLAAEKGSFVKYERGEGVTLSAGGRKRALEIVRHHRLVETFLFEMLEYPLQEVHDEAERLEHFISEKFEARIAKKLGNPNSDPHGHCIPSINGIMPRSHGISCRCGL